MKYYLLFLTAAVAFSACDINIKTKAKGNGNLVEQERPVKAFSKVDISSVFKVVVRQGDVSKVVVAADENLQEFILVYVEGETLHIEQKPNTSITTRVDCKVVVTGAFFKAFEVSGASQLITENKLKGNDDMKINLSGASQATVSIKAPNIFVDLSGASSLEIDGETKDFATEASGSSRVKAFNLLSENTTVHVSGASSAQVFASVLLNADASGASQILYKGVGDVKANKSGAGSVERAD